MSMVNKCTVCDEPVNPYGGETRCDRCCQPCPTCRGDVMLCKHPLPAAATPYSRFSFDVDPATGRPRVAA